MKLIDSENAESSERKLRYVLRFLVDCRQSIDICIRGTTKKRKIGPSGHVKMKFS